MPSLGRVMVLNFTAFAAARMCPPPYRWAWLHDPVEPSAMQELCATFPSAEFILREGGESNPYRSAGRRLVHLGSNTMVDDLELDGVWRELVSDLLGPEYRQTIAALTGLDLDTAGLQITIYQNDPICWLPPHTDDAPKLVTQTLYFNELWSPDADGYLLMLRSEDINDVAERIPPTPGNSIVHIRSSDSWHAVLPMSGDANEIQYRRSMTISFYDTPEMWVSIYGNSPLGSIFPDN